MIVHNLNAGIGRRRKGVLAMLLMLVSAFSARALAALGVIGLSFVVGLYYGANGVGLLAISQGIIIGAGLIARLGLDLSIIKYVGADPHSIKVLSYLRWSLCFSSFLGGGLTVAIYFCSDLIEVFFSYEGLSGVLRSMVFALPLYVFCSIAAGFLKGVGWPASGCLLENGAIAFGASAILYFAFGGWGEGYPLIGWAYFFSSIAFFVLSLAFIFLWYFKEKGGMSSDFKGFSARELFSSGVSMFFASFSTFMQNVLLVLCAGMVLSEADMGVFRISQQLGLVLAFALIVINSVLPPKFSALFIKGDISELESLARMGAIVGACLVFPVFLLFVAFPESILSIFGDEFSGTTAPLVIISFAQFFSVATGSVAFVLNMTSYDKLMRNISIFSNLIGFLCLSILLPWIGVNGAALSLATVLILQNLIALYYVWRKLGIWTVFVPNFYSFLGVRPIGR